MSSDHSSNAATSILRPGALHFRHIFLHFFDLHFLQERGDFARSPMARREMDLAVRFAVMLAGRISLPAAASYYENPVAQEILEPYLRSEVGMRFEFVGTGNRLEDLIEEKLQQYPSGSTQSDIYRSGLSQPVGWRPRTRSTGADLAESFRRSFDTDDIPRLFHGALSYKISDAELERLWKDVPDRLGKRAFIIPHLKPLLPLEQCNLIAESRLYHINNQNYLISYIMDVGACVFQNMQVFGGASVPSAVPPDDVQFGHLKRACELTGLLKDILAATPTQLDELANRESFIAAFRGTHTAGPFERPIANNKDDRIPVDLAIISALGEERQALEAVFGKGRRGGDHPNDPFVYTRLDLTIKGTKHSVVIGTPSGMTTAPAAVLATHMLRTFSPGLIVLVGIAGGCPSHLRIEEHVRLGDVVVANKVFEYDHVKMLPDGTIEYRDTPQWTSHRWRQAVMLLHEGTGFNRAWRPDFVAACQRMNLTPPPPSADILRDWVGNIIVHPDDPRRTDGAGIVHIGVVGSGDTLLTDPRKRDELRDKFKVRAVEMEASGVRAAAAAVDAHYIVVRGIVDYCDGAKGDLWHMTAVTKAAAVAKLMYATLVADPTPAGSPN